MARRSARTLVARISILSLATAAGVAVEGAAAQPATPGYERRAAAVASAEAGRPLADTRGGTPAQAVSAALNTLGRDAATTGALREAEVRVGRNGHLHRRFEQSVDGVPVHGAYAKAAFNRSRELVHLIDHLAPVPAQIGAARVDALQALRAAMLRVHPGVQAEFRPAGRRGQAVLFDGGAFFHTAPAVSAVAIPLVDGSMQRGWLVETWTQRSNQLHHILVGGDGRVLSVESRTANDSYKIFQADPGKGPQTIIDGPASGGIESPNGWLGGGTQKTVRITGNNARAYLDRDANNRADSGGTTVSDERFVATAGLTRSPGTTANRAVSVQNLFYLTNLMHDILYRHGFDEVAGNFQNNNFGRGGLGGDPVLAEAQDGSGTDNANFATPSDGQSPRMQMYLWTPPGTHQVAVGGGASYNASPSQYGPALTTTGVAGQVVRPAPADGCTSIATPLAGKVALIDRGTCEFTKKTLNAQAAGAVAVIIANNNSIKPDDTFTMAAGAGASGVTIPAVLISLNSGNALKSVLPVAATLRQKAVQPPQLDAALDADIVFHEYCHGLTWRMIGGMSGPMAGAIGEGMSDACALLINGDDPNHGDVVGEYSGADALGIRRYRYDGYPLTYANLAGAEVHDDGELYAAIVWDLLKVRFGFARRDALFTTLVDGMNYTPSTPKFEDMRDGILQALAGNPADTCLVWTSFAKFGVGVGANGASFPPAQSFVKPATCP